jgi:hypothetical protein
MDKSKLSKSYKQTIIEPNINLNSTKEENYEKIEVSKKKIHKKSNSNIEEFAFGEKTKLDEQLQNFVSNYDGKQINIMLTLMLLYYLDLIKGIKNQVKLSKEEKTQQESKTKSDGHLNINSNKLKLVSQSAVFTNNDPNSLSNIVTQLDEKYDIQNLTNIEEIKDYYEYTENCLQLIAKLKMPSINELEPLMLDLPEKLLKKKLAIFDLDETLIHCELKNPQKAEKLITIKLPNGTKARVRMLNKYFFK